MSADREMGHLENMSGMNGSRHWNQPYCYATTDEQNAEAARVEEEAKQRLSRNTWDDLKRTARAMGVDL